MQLATYTYPEVDSLPRYADGEQRDDASIPIVPVYSTISTQRATGTCFNAEHTGRIQRKSFKLPTRPLPGYQSPAGYPVGKPIKADLVSEKESTWQALIRIGSGQVSQISCNRYPDSTTLASGKLQGSFRHMAALGAMWCKGVAARSVGRMNDSRLHGARQQWVASPSAKRNLSIVAAMRKVVHQIGGNTVVFVLELLVCMYADCLTSWIAIWSLGDQKF